MQLLGMDTPVSQQARDIVIRNNVFLDIREDYALDIVRVIQATGLVALTLDHNAFHYREPMQDFFRAVAPNTTGLVYTNNTVLFGNGFLGRLRNERRRGELPRSDATIAGNLLVGGPDATFGGSNHYPAGRRRRRVRRVGRCGLERLRPVAGEPVRGDGDRRDEPGDRRRGDRSRDGLVSLRAQSSSARINRAV